jgi:hypothetical protein
MTRRKETDPSRHTKRTRSTRASKSRRVGPTDRENAAGPREHGHRTVVPKRPRTGQPPGHVGAR